MPDFRAALGRVLRLSPNEAPGQTQIANKHTVIHGVLNMAQERFVPWDISVNPFLKV